MTEYIHELKIPKDRIAVLIGKKGEIKKMLEEQTHTKITVSSEDGDVMIKGEDTIMVYNTQEIIKAVGRGFNPMSAIKLLKQDYTFEMINLKDYVKGKNHMQRLKGRVIGSEGKARRTIEELTDTEICVYGKTIGILGEVTNAIVARRAVDSLLKGSPHASVYKWLEKNRAEVRRFRMESEYAG